MAHKFFLVLFLLSFFGNGCKTESNTNKADSIMAGSKKQSSDPIEKIEEAHKKSIFLEKGAVQFDIILNFGGSERLNGTMTLTANSSKGLIQLKDSSEILFIGDSVYYSNPDKNPKSIRFAAYTWSYFFLFPYKLSDPGTNWSELESRELAGKSYDFQKLTFDAGTGDAPDDWYLMYSDQKSNLIEHAAYIVTAGSSQSEAEKDPHSIQYSNYKEIEGIPISHNWIFWEWRKKEGLTKELGNAQLSNFKFINKTSDLFIVKDGFLNAE